MRFILIILNLVSFLVCTSICYPFILKESIKQVPITDEELRQIAIENRIIPEHIDDDYLKDELHQKNTITMWIVLKAEQKVTLIDKLKDEFYRNGIIIRLPSNYYVNEINGVIYNGILKGDIDADVREGLGSIFKTIAVMDGDYDDGSDRIELLKQLIGDELFEKYKQMYPDKYRYLLRINKTPR